MEYPKTFQNWAAFYEGESFFGIVTEGAPNIPTVKIAKSRPAGYSGEVPEHVGDEMGETTLSFKEWSQDLTKKRGQDVTLTLRAGLLSDAKPGEVDGWIFTIRGMVTKVEFPSFKAGDQALQKVTISQKEVKIELGGEELLHIDPARGISANDGKNRFGPLNEFLGIGASR